MKIIQLVNGYSKGDGVGNVITAIDQLLKSRGYETEICNQALNMVDLHNDEFQGENIVLYHVALSVDPLVSFLKCKKILVFHNITDPELLIGSGLQQMRNWCSAGLYDIRTLSKYFEAAIVFSEYSKNTLIESGWTEDYIYQMPIMVRFNKLAQQWDAEIVEKYSDGYTNILFTGRIFPNKKQEDIIYAFAEYKKTYNNKSRLFLVGGAGNKNYFEALKKLVKELGLDDDIVLTGRVPFSEYLAYYKIADVFLCMSAHEGFCIPIVEALYFGLPIIAVNSTAIPDTLGGSGFLIDSRDSTVAAEAVNRVVSDEDFRNELLENEKGRLEELQPDVIEKLYLNVLNKCISNTESGIKFKHLERTRVLFDNIAIPQELRMRKNIIYGFGAAGNRLLDHLKNEGIHIEAICDQNKAGMVERYCSIIGPMEAFSVYRNENFIISIQDKKILKKVISLMIKEEISEEHIFVFDEMKDEIV